MLKLSEDQIRSMWFGDPSEVKPIADAASRHTLTQIVRFFREQARGGLSYDASWDEDADMLVELARKEGIEIDA